MAQRNEEIAAAAAAAAAEAAQLAITNAKLDVAEKEQLLNDATARLKEQKTKYEEALEEIKILETAEKKAIDRLAAVPPDASPEDRNAAQKAKDDATKAVQTKQAEASTLKTKLDTANAEAETAKTELESAKTACSTSKPIN